MTRQVTTVTRRDSVLIQCRPGFPPAQAVNTLIAVGAEFAIRWVEISFVGPPPAAQLRRAPGVSGVEVEGSTVRCLVEGSFQPFLETLRGYEVVTLSSTAELGRGAGK